jgi:hypothetical protein
MIVVASDGELVCDVPSRYLAQFNPVYAAGFGTVQNLLEWMGGSEDLLALRARDVKARALEDVDPPKRKLVSWANVVAMPLLLLFAGIVVFIVRRYQR